MRSIVFFPACLVVGTSSASAQDRRPAHCIALADAAPEIEYLHRAKFLT